MSLVQQAVSNDQHRKSTRKTKKIDRDRFVQSYAFVRHKYHQPRHVRVDKNVQNYCTKLMLSTEGDQQHLLREMNRAYTEQSEKLYELLKIKLAEDPQCPKKETQSLLYNEREFPSECVSDICQEIIRKASDGQIEEEQRQNSYWPQEYPQQKHHKLMRRDSARMLCDNYQSHQLIYTMETLVPRIHKEDVDELIEEMK